MARETVIGVFDRDGLHAVLLRIHQRRLGAQVRVLDAARGAVEQQLSRAGFPFVAGPEIAALGDRAAVVLVSAPGRQDEVARLFTDLGARAVTITRAAAPSFTFADTARDQAVRPTHPGLLQPERSADTGDAASS